MDFNNVLLMFITRIKAPLLSCHMFYDLHKPSPSVSEKHSSGEHTVLFIVSIGQDFIPVHIYIFAMASTVLTKESTQDDVLQFLEDNSLS